MFEIGRLCLKIAGRDAGLKCVIIEVIDSNYVLIDGQTRRRKCNIIHLKPLDKVLKVKKGLAHDDVVKELKKEKIEVKAKQKRAKAKTEEKPEIKKEIPKERPELKKEKPVKPKKEEKPVKPKKKKVVKKAEVKPKKTAVKKSPVKKVGKATKKVSKAKPKAKTIKK